jgi:hypothetical protein
MISGMECNAETADLAWLIGMDELGTECHPGTHDVEHRAAKAPTQRISHSSEDRAVVHLKSPRNLGLGTALISG